MTYSALAPLLTGLSLQIIRLEVTDMTEATRALTAVGSSGWLLVGDSQGGCGTKQVNWEGGFSAVHRYKILLHGLFNSKPST